MNFIKTAIEDVYIVEPLVFEDERGHFFESYNQEVFEKNGLYYQFIQDNQSKSAYGTIRGLHFQRGEFSQAKLVRVLDGVVLDVAVDLRSDSKTFGQHIAVELSAENKRQLMIPRGFAHGFSVLSDTAVFSYKCDNVYNKASESGLRFNDQALGINWKIDLNKALLSEKDLEQPLLKDFVQCF